MKKTSFEALEKIKEYFLEQILKKQYASKEEIIKRGRYMGFDLEQPFYIAAIDYQMKGGDTDNDLEQNDQMLETIAKYLNIQGYKALIGQYESNILMLIPEESHLLAKIEKILEHLEMTHSSYKFKIGISDRSANIENINESLEEALIALRMFTEEKIIYFHDLGIVGVLINSKNVNGIKRIAAQELDPLFKLSPSKQSELIKTLYVFLSNGGKLQKTMDDLCLSMSGLMYRVNKLEELLNKDLRDPQQSYQLLLVLDSLIAIGELDL